MLRSFLLCLSILLSPALVAGETNLPNPQVVIKTSDGDITLRLFRDRSANDLSSLTISAISHFAAKTL